MESALLSKSSQTVCRIVHLLCFTILKLPYFSLYLWSGLWSAVDREICVCFLNLWCSWCQSVQKLLKICFTHLLSSFSASISICPSLYFTGLYGSLGFPARFSMVWKSCFMVLLVAAASACSAIPSSLSCVFSHFSLLLRLLRYVIPAHWPLICCSCAAVVNCFLLSLLDFYLSIGVRWHPVFLLWFFPTQDVLTCSNCRLIVFLPLEVFGICWRERLNTLCVVSSSRNSKLMLNLDFLLSFSVHFFFSLSLIFAVSIIWSEVTSAIYLS